MNRNMKTIIGISSIIAEVFIISILAYYIGSFVSQGFLSAGGTSYSTWQAHYLKLVIYMGIITVILSLVWYVMSRFVLKVQFALNTGKRTIWSVLGLAELVACIVIPYTVAAIDRQLSMNIMIPILFVLLYALIGYWGGSILTTPAPFKYTPLGAVKIRAYRGRK